MRNWFLSCSIIILFQGCANNLTDRDDNKSYNSLILNIAMAHPDFKCFACYVGTKEECDYLKSNILEKRKIIKDETSPLILSLHSWSTHGGDFPKSIVHVSNGANFEYAFPFFDEYYFSSERLRECNRGSATLGNHLSFVVNQIERHKGTKTHDANSLITLVMDSLLQMEEYPLKDTTAFRRLIEADLKDASSYSTNCAETLSASVLEIIKAAKRESVRIFKCQQGKFGIWMLEIVAKGGSIKVNSEFLNSDCYFVSLL